MPVFLVAVLRGFDGAFAFFTISAIHDLLNQKWGPTCRPSISGYKKVTPLQKGKEGQSTFVVTSLMFYSLFRSQSVDIELPNRHIPFSHDQYFEYRMLNLIEIPLSPSIFKSEGKLLDILN